MDIPYRGNCNVRRHRSLDPPTVSYEATIVVQHHPFFITSGDRAYRLHCVYRQEKTTLEQNLNINELPTEPVQGTSSPTCRYDVLSETLHGPALRFANVGDPVVHRWSCDGSGYGFLVHSCVVQDEAKTEYKLIDERGCVTDSSLVPEITYSNDFEYASTTIRAFRFAEQLVVHFSCQITLCSLDEQGCEGISPPACHPTKLPPTKVTYRAGTVGSTEPTEPTEPTESTVTTTTTTKAYYPSTRPSAHTFYTTSTETKKNESTTNYGNLEKSGYGENTPPVDDSDYHPFAGRDIDWTDVAGSTPKTTSRTTMRYTSRVTLPPRLSSKFEGNMKMGTGGGYDFPNHPPPSTQGPYSKVKQVSGGSYGSSSQNNGYGQSKNQNYGQAPGYTPYDEVKGKGSTEESFNYGLEIVRGTTSAGYQIHTISKIQSGMEDLLQEMPTSEPLPYPAKAGIYFAANRRSARSQKNANETEERKKMTVEVESKDFLVFTSDNPILRQSLANSMKSKQKLAPNHENSNSCGKIITIQGILLAICAIMQIASIVVILYQRRYYVRTLKALGNECGPNL
ncbi:hypothetical protein WR25_07166 [Diploscapter pachys]|uniref:ZP domain-containing protein n=1 Tax=Diploscapter pachys TaxID=2018661 RepID=A0A2A2KUC6_9BILA|nr:hypothetical protein WR25_07166 [Diploscapter pachys]